MLALALALALVAFGSIAYTAWRTLRDTDAAAASVRECGRGQRAALATVRVEAERARRLRAPRHDA